MPTPPPSPRAAIDFSPFQLDLSAGLLRRDTTGLHLRPKTFEVLRYLAERPGELVTKDALLDAVWGGVAVTEDVVRICVGELRAALGDQRAAPRFIETVPRRGYRFVATLGAVEKTRSESSDVAISAAPQLDGAMVGRVRERGLIAEWLRAAKNGQRQVALISGEAGIGKTTLVDAALRELRRSPAAEWRIARGQCVEHFGGGEPYLPVLDALADVCRSSDGETVRASLAEHAPDWVLRALGAGASAPGETMPMPASTHEHTLHKLAASLDALATEKPLVLVLEDVQWSDYATLDLVSVLAHHRESAARLLVLCTLRPADAIVHGHPVAGVKRELVRKGICHEIALEGLSAKDVATYLEARFEGADLPEELLRMFVDRTDGNPFFLATLVDHVLEQGLLVKSDEGWEVRGSVDALRTAMPEGLRAVIEPRLNRLTLDELAVFEAASVVGPEFPAHAVAHIALPDRDLGDVEVVEHLCDGLVRRQEILRTAGESTWPDGTTSARYAFRHALYQQVAYQRLSLSTCRRLHQAIGERLEAAYAGSTRDVASELAAHFERSRDVERAIRYRQEAAGHAGSRSAYQETRLHLQAALDLLASLPESADNLRRRMALSNDLGWTLLAVNSWGNDDTLRAFTEMRELAERLEDPSMSLRAMEAIRSVHTVRADYTASRALCEETMALAEGLGDEMAAGAARTDLATCLLQIGEFERALDHAERGRALFDEASIHGMSNRLLLASSCAQLGQVARSRAMGLEAVAGAERLGGLFFRAWSRTFAAANRQLLLDVEGTRSLAAEGMRLAAEGAFSALRGVGSITLGWCDIQGGRTEEGRAAVQAGFVEHRASGQRVGMSSFHAILAAAHLACGDVAAADQVLDAGFAFAAETGERFAEHELHRLRGECALATATTRGERARAAEHFGRAIAIAAGRKATLFELRAATSLLRLRGKAVRERVARLVERFDAENDCADARAARALLGA